MLKTNPKQAKMVEVISADSMIDLIKQSQMITGKAHRSFIVDDDVIKVSYDGQNLVANGVICNDGFSGKNVLTRVI